LLADPGEHDAMAAVTVNIAIQPELLADIDAVASREARSRSELLREAARLYLERQRRWESVFRLCDQAVRRRRITQEDVAAEIAAFRRGRRRRR